MKTSEHAKQLIAAPGWEDLETEWYPDSGGEPTIGVGHLLTLKERKTKTLVIGGVSVDYTKGLTRQQCFDLFAQDLIPVEKTVNESVKVPLTQNQFDALVSFVFNIGNYAFKNSTLLLKLNQERYAEVPTQMKRWNKVKGRIVKGLVNRREKEIALWKGEI